MRPPFKFFFRIKNNSVAFHSALIRIIDFDITY